MTKPLQLNDINDLKENYKLGVYKFDVKRPNTKILKDTYVFDEDLSVKKNKEMVKEHNEKAKRLEKEYWDGYHAKINEFTEDFITVIQKEINTNREKADKIYSYIYREHHSAGYREMIYYAEDIIELIKEILN